MAISFQIHVFGTWAGVIIHTLSHSNFAAIGVPSRFGLNTGVMSRV